MSLRNLPSAFRKQPKWLRITTYLLCAYLTYALILGVLTPWILQSQLSQLLSDKLHRVVSIEKVRINPFLLRIRVSNLVIEENKSHQPFVNVSLFEVDASFWQTLLHFTPTLEHLSIIEPYGHIARLAEGEQAQFNFSDIIDSLNEANAEKEPVEKEQTEIPPLRVNRVNLEGGQIRFSDDVSNTNIIFPNLAFEVTDFDTRAATFKLTEQQNTATEDNHYNVKIETSEGGSIGFAGQVQLAPFEIKGNIALSAIALAPLWPLSNDVIEARLTNGLLDFYGDYHLSEGQESLRFQANNTQLTLSELTISDLTQPRITVAEINIHDLSLDTDTEQIDVAEVIISKPWIDGNLDEQGLDLQAMFMPSSIATTKQTSSLAEQQVNTQTSQIDESNWRVILQSFALNNGDIQINESHVSKGMHWRVFDLNATTGVVDTSFQLPIEYSLDLGVGGEVRGYPEQASGYLSSDGKVNVSSEQVSGSFEINQFALSQLQSYLLPYVNAILQDGAVGISGTFEAGTASPITFTGDANIANLTVIDGLQQQPLLKWQDMNIQGIQYQSLENQLSVQAVMFDKPYTKFIIHKGKQTNIGDLLVQNASTEADSALVADDASPPESAAQAGTEDTQSASNNIAIRIDDISINDGSAYFEDNSLRAPFASGIEALNGNIKSLSSTPDTTANVNLMGKIDGYAPVILKGEVNPLIEQIYLDLNFSVDGAELTSVNPYSGTYMGHFIDKGLLSLNVEYKLENNQLVGDNKIVIDQLTLGRKTNSEQAVNLPLSLAIALLQDSNGVIDLGMEVSGDLNNPSFGFGSIIFKALGNIITKAVTAPFSLLANLVGSEDELNKVTFADGSAELNEAASQTLQTLAAALAKRPGLKVDIEGSVNEVTDAYELAEQKLQANLLEISKKTSLPEGFSPSTVPLSGPIADALRTLFTTATNKEIEEQRKLIKARLQEGDSEKIVPEEQLEQALMITMYNQVRSTINVPRHELAKLAEDRAKSVKMFLSENGSIDPNRLFLLNSRQHLASAESGVTLTLKAN
ncbi:DUF748 domain-containing protein [Aliiglaciecola lipolytica]|uniref:DUF748 domain-containing protein n=1 Tax=Aliiglaciecola lipolytica TaxID=477689 RepID=UPI001C089F94|nr:DUF748 domain-containing protein [Aliiglaciecola lipolytica]MBU2879276.1 DUF748 domain-containing protein [Aliiglaciecola lipolytica]